MAHDAAVSQRLDADGDPRRGDRSRSTLPRVLPLPRRAIRHRSARRHHGTVDRRAVCERRSRARAAPAGIEFLHRHGHRRHRRSASSRSVSGANRGPSSSVLGPWSATRRAHVGGGRAAVRGRSRGRARVRGAADFCQERESVARPAAAARGNTRVQNQGEGRATRSGGVACELPDQPGLDEHRASPDVARRDGRRTGSR